MRLLVVLWVAALVGLGAFAARAGDGSGSAPAVQSPPLVAGQEALGPLERDRGPRVRDDFRRPPRAGLLVDLDTGEVLWERRAGRSFPIASLTKMMTALVVAERLRPGDKARITPEVLRYSGSGVGVLPRGRRVRVETLLHGLMLASGNDAARALAIRVAGSQRAFVRLMNASAARMGLACTRFASVEGLSDLNRSCARDLAALARRVLDEPRLAAIVRRRRARLPLAIRGGRVELWNHNPLVRSRYRGVLGVKTGYTDAAGRCLVAAARRGGRRLAAVVLDSPDPGRQARHLLDRGFAAIR